MPPRIRFIGRYGNIAMALLCAVGVIATLSEGSLGGTVVLLGFGLLATFNFYVIDKSAKLLAEEEWLKAELRKAELRRQLAALHGPDEDEALPPQQQP